MRDGEKSEPFPELCDGRGVRTLTRVDEMVDEVNEIGLTLGGPKCQSMYVQLS